MIALIAEGATEEAILKVLLNHNALIYSYSDLLEQRVIRTRNGKEFARKHLNKSMGEKVEIFRVLDSRNEVFNLPKAYLAKVEKVTNVQTRPEVEILHIIYHGDYQSWSKSSQHGKPSSYAKSHYHDFKNIKSGTENFDFWDTHFEGLLEALRTYKKYPSRETTIAALLK